MIQPDLIDRNLNINLHPLEGAAIPIVQFNGAVQVDLSTADLVFELKGLVKIPLQAHPSDPKGRMLVISKDHVKNVPKIGTPFALVDKSGIEPLVRWVGVLKKTDW